MKKYVSIFMLSARETLYKALGVMILMGAGQIGIYWLSCRNAMREYEAEMQNVLNNPDLANWNVPYPSLETILDQGPMSLPWIELLWAMALVALIVLLGSSGNSIKGAEQSRYTVQRLNVKEWKQVICQAIYNFAVFIIFWAFSVGIALLICKLFYSQADPASYGSQSIYLMFYRNDLFHSLLPLAEVLRYVRNVCMFLAFAVLCAVDVFWKRRGKKIGAGIFVNLYLALSFIRPMGDNSSNLIWIIASIVCVGVSVYYLVCHLEEDARE